MRPASPSLQETATASPTTKGSAAPPAPTTAGMPISRAMVAVWHVRLPRMATIAPRLLHEGLPIGVGHDGNKDLALLEAAYFVYAL
eukprot:5504774-Alexandrium_andersonii.AAC.1